jgi:hypothetical protein
MNKVSPYLSRGIFKDTEGVPSGVPVLFKNVRVYHRFQEEMPKG